MNNVEYRDLEEDGLLQEESFNHLKNVKKTPYVSHSPYQNQMEVDQCSLGNGSGVKDSMENCADQSRINPKIAPLNKDPSSVGKDKSFTIYINELPALVSSTEPFVNPQRLFHQPGLLLLDITSQVQAMKTSESLTQESRKSMADALAERERLRKKLKISRMKIARAAQATAKRRIDGEHGATSKDTKSTEDRVNDKEQTTTLSVPPSEPCVADETLETAEPESRKRKGHDTCYKDTNPEEIAATVNEVTLLTRQITNLKKKIQNTSPLSPPPVLLLPSPCNGCVRVYADHHYRTVKFIGEHLCLTGLFKTFSAAPYSQSADVFSSLCGEDLAEVCEKEPVNANTECINSTQGNAKTHQMNSKPQESESGWINLEMIGLKNYLKKHPGAIADEFFKLPTEERAAYTTKTL